MIQQPDLYCQALKHLGFAPEALEEIKQGYFGDKVIIINPEQIPTLRKYLHLENFYFSLPENLEGLATALLQTEPLIGKIGIVAESINNINFTFSQYLDWLSREEFPHLYQKKTVEKPAAFTFTPNSRPCFVLETPSGLVAQLYQVQKRKKEIIASPLTKILDTPFLHQLQQDIQSLEKKIGSCAHLPLFSGIISSGEETGASFFHFAKEEIYLVYSKKEGPVCIGFFSTEEKEKKYALQDMISFFHREEKKLQNLFQALLARKIISLNREYGTKQLAALEAVVLRKEGFSLLASGSFEQGKKLVQLKLSAMERYALLPEILSQEEHHHQLITWQSLQDVLLHGKELSALPFQQLVHFTEAHHPVVMQLLSKILPTGTYAHDGDHFSQQFSLASSEEKKALLAGKVAEKLQLQENEKKISQDLQKLMGAEHLPLITEVIEVLR